MKTITSMAATFALLAGVAAIAAPERSRAAFEAFNKGLSDLTAPDCDTDPVACLDRREDDLQAALGDISRGVSELKAEQENAQEAARKAQALSARNALFAEEGRRLLDTQMSGPYSFIGVSYPDRTALEAQVRFVWNEKQTLDASAAEAATVARHLSEARAKVNAQEAQVLAALEVIPSKRALVRANKIVGGIAEDLSSIDDVLASSRAASNAKDALLRTTRELQADADSGLVSNSVGDAAFEAWLKQGSQRP
ncbi:hypothetical protein [Donghicola eburneus]|uniref:Secreted protein n=1 Tax=Donghicola eburneus TaxID=393278 RepID=A0A1M4MXL0_9RHOB|nr:hypothetical protein [Donghicola eburneus]SCM66445.1 hypothetical protein KARMA_0620 [Donghicola eburneus]